MLVCRTKHEMREVVAAARRQGHTIGLVPTMGALHEGHLSLVRRSVADGGLTVVSVFVNPTQFGPAEDLDKYPRQLEADTESCRREGADAIFAPDAAEMYPEDSSTWVEETALSTGLCGASRPGHFRGVATVVAKLFNIVLPDRAYFGQKDAQQAAVIKRMARDLDFPVEVVVMPIVREPDGLAKSSRNRYLTPSQRQEALALSRALDGAEGLFRGGERNVATLVEAMAADLRRAPGARIDYIEIVDAGDLRHIEEIRRPALAALAVFVGSTRLIDNRVLEP